MRAFVVAGLLLTGVSAGATLAYAAWLRRQAARRHTITWQERRKQQQLALLTGTIFLVFALALGASLLGNL